MPKKKATTGEAKRVLLVQTGYIGDVIFASPLVYALKQHDQNLQVTMLVRNSTRQVADCVPGLDGTIGCRVTGNQRWPRGLRALRRVLEKNSFDILICPDRAWRATLLSGMSGIPRRIGYRTRMSSWAFTSTIKPRAGGSGRIEQDLQLLGPLDVPPAGSRLRLQEPRNQDSYVQGFYRKHGLKQDSKLAALCVGSYWPPRRWPAVYFASLVESLRRRGYEPVLFGGPAEAGLAVEIAQARGGAVVSCLGNRLIESAALMARCRLAVGGDSGLTHMARALGVPTVMVFGPTDPRAYSFEDNTRVLRAQVRCRPCSSNGPRRCREGHHDCMRLVSPEDVLDALDSLVDLRTPAPTLAKPPVNNSAVGTRQTSRR